MVKCFSENEVKTILAVFYELNKMPYDKLNTFLGSLTIKEMHKLWDELTDWYQIKVLLKKFNKETGQYED